jgi:basic amino acid/polyamine antiporter, APA family
MSMSRYTARKSLQAIVAGTDDRRLSRALGPVSLIGLGIGCIIGAGIFVLTGKAAASYAGPAIMLSFVLSGIACGFVGLCYAELAAMIPVAGSAYTYTYATIGEIFAWIIGWDLILEYAMGASTVAVGWSGYAVSLLKSFGISFPAQWADASGAAVKLADGTIGTAVCNLPAILVVVVLTALLMIGTRESTRVNNVMVAFKLFVVAVVILCAQPQLGPVHSGKHRQFWLVWPQRHAARRLGGVLRLYRL